MYASKRTIGRQGLYTGVTVKESKQPKHDNRPNGNGRQSYVQVIKDEKGFVKKTLVHITGHDIFRIRRRKRRLRKSMANQPR